MVTRSPLPTTTLRRATVRVPRSAVNVCRPGRSENRADARALARPFTFATPSTRKVTAPEGAALSARTRALAAWAAAGTSSPRAHTPSGIHVRARTRRPVKQNRAPRALRRGLRMPGWLRPSVGSSPPWSRRSDRTATSISTLPARSPATSSPTAARGWCWPGRRARDRRSTTSSGSQLIEAVVDEVGDRASVIATTGTYDTRHSVHLTREARAAGADAFLVVTPYYSKPPAEGVYRHFRAIADVAADLPIVVYNIPQRVVINLPPELLLRLGADRQRDRREAGHHRHRPGAAHRRRRARAVRRQRRPAGAVRRDRRRRRHLRRLARGGRRHAGARRAPATRATWSAPARSTPSCRRSTTRSR